MPSQQVKFHDTNLLKRDAGDPGRGHPGRRRRNKGTEGVGGNHEGVSECTEVGSIKHLFSAYVAWVDCTRDLVKIHLLCFNTVMEGTIFEVDMPLVLVPLAQSTVPWLSLYIWVGPAASGRFMSSQRCQRERISLTTSSVAQISASQVEQLVCS